MKYIERLKTTESYKEQKEANFATEEAEIQLQADVLGCKRNVSQLTRELDDLKSAKDFDSVSILNKSDALEMAKKDLKTLKELQKELF